MRVGLLECDHVAPRFRHIAGDYRDMFGAWLAPAAPAVTLVPFDVCNGQFPSSVDACNAYLCTGSRCAAYDQADWILRLLDFVRGLHTARMPFVGICFGHQVLAEALGGNVERASSGWGVGVHGMDVIRGEAWMQPPSAACRLQYMHQDQVVRLPPGAELLGRTDHCQVAMFGVGETMLAIQGHPEFPVAYAEALIGDRIERIGADRAVDGRTSLAQPIDERLAAEWIARFFARASMCGAA
jgi:GMP synthase-like glutamine amidotransferase